MYFCKILHGIQSGNDGDTARSLYIKISCVRARPLSFFVRQGKAPEEILQNMAGSLGHVTASLGHCVWSCYVGNRANVYFQMKNHSKWPMLGLEESHCKGVGQENK